jgi:hypothetical protein
MHRDAVACPNEKREQIPTASGFAQQQCFYVKGGSLFARFGLMG